MQFTADTITRTIQQEEEVLSATLGDYKAIIVYDEDGESPREWDNLGTVVAKHPRYNLADEDAVSVSRIQDVIKKNPKSIIVLPVYIYDHSGVSLSTTPFSCRWDSGQVGYIYVTRLDIQREYEEVPSDEKIKEYLKNEIETYSEYLKGEVYGYQILNKDNEEVDSCYGFIGREHAEEEALSALKYFKQTEGN